MLCGLIRRNGGFRGEIDFTCVKELENTRPALFGIKGTR